MKNMYMKKTATGIWSRYKRDAKGNLMFDKNGQPIYKTQIVFDGETGYRDSSFDNKYEEGELLKF